MMRLPYIERAARWCFWSIEGIGPVRMRQTIALCSGDLYTLWSNRTQRAHVLNRLGLTDRQYFQLGNMFKDVPWSYYEAELGRLGPVQNLLYQDDEAYPDSLRSMEDAPSFLYTEGQRIEPFERRIALVGSRRIRDRDGLWARRFSAELAHQGHLHIVSGGAIGMDAHAHRGALDSGRPTIAVLPSGLNCPTPASHRRLFKQIATTGTLISEYPLRVCARRYHFPRRNRLIVALSDGVVVLKARQKGGTMLTANIAIKRNVPLGVVPYDVTDEGAAGSLSLLAKKQTFLVRDPQDVLSNCYAEKMRQAQGQLFFQPRTPPDDALSYKIWTLCAQQIHINDLSQSLDLDISALLAKLLLLELSGHVTQVGALSYLQS